MERERSGRSEGRHNTEGGQPEKKARVGRDGKAARRWGEEAARRGGRMGAGECDAELRIRETGSAMRIGEMRRGATGGSWEKISSADACERILR
uniref:Uncharacterized protein n=1 Tax=Oryza glumipatula TaxID=40148 RepID=A0A0D9ZKU4_9ORYZ